MHLSVLALAVLASCLSSGAVAGSAVLRAPVDCDLSEWKTATPCDETLPLQFFERTVVTEPANGGRPCPPLHKKQRCKPVHCEVTPWGPWGLCEEDGTKSRQRSVVVAAQFGGRECPYLVDKLKCHPIDCLVGKWGDWRCDHESGKLVRERRVTREKMGDGSGCPSLVETSTESCRAVDCALEPRQSCTKVNAVGGWSKWMRSTTQVVKAEHQHGGKPCVIPEPEISATQVCYCLPWEQSYDACLEALAKSTPPEEDLNYAVRVFKYEIGLELWQCIDQCAAYPGCMAYVFVRNGLSWLTQTGSTCFLCPSAVSEYGGSLFFSGHVSGRTISPKHTGTVLEGSERGVVQADAAPLLSWNQ